MQDAFRARVMFPIFDRHRRGGGARRPFLPGSSDPAKYKNSPETPIYPSRGRSTASTGPRRRSSTPDQVVVCEGYTDVIGFHRAGVARAVATCGTAFTEEHVRLLKRYANRVVLAFDADAAGQGAADRFYEWEQKYQVAVSVARLPDGTDPGELAQRDPEASPRPSPGRRRSSPSACAASSVASRGAPRRSACASPSGRWRSSTSTPTSTCASCTPARWRPRPDCRSAISRGSRNGASGRR